ncbi:MAG: right-handed parallel beta-helix repeat-containing protein [Spirochaetales bacterium]|nr:right-handed parallel beta-helix repeat-containing protein [Spirochaetales bacterium]
MRKSIALYVFISLLSALISVSCSWNNPYAPGFPAGSITGLILSGAVSSGFVTIDLTFNQTLDLTTAENVGNYSIPGLAVNAAAVLPSNNVVRLITGVQSDQVYTVTVINVQDAALSLTIGAPNNTANFTGIGYTPTPYTPDITVSTTIQAAVDAASPGDVVYVPPGTYDEKVVVGKQITLTGAGSGNNPSVDTILDFNTGEVATDHTILITAGGISTVNRLILCNFRVIGDAGTGNDGCPIVIQAGDYITFENITSTNNGGDGIDFDPGNSLTQDIIVNYCNLSNNGNHGLRIPSGLANINGLQVTNSTFVDNVMTGIEAYTLGTSSNIVIDNCVFSDNATNQYQFADIYIGSFYGNLTMNNLLIDSNNTESGIRLGGSSSVSAAGTMSFSNLTFVGTSISLGAYPSAALTITRYSDVSNVTFNNIQLKSNAPSGLFLGTITTNPMNIGTFTFNGTYANDITLGRHGNSASYAYTDVAIDATSAVFTGAVNDADIEARVYHNPDDPNLGIVSWTTP